jgi:hypothetical protein
LQSVGLGGAASLGNLLSLPTHVLQDLLLSRNELDDEAIASLSDGVAHSGSLRSLDLSENTFGAKGAASLGAALATAGLETLKVSKNLLTDAGGASIVTAVAHNTSLTELWLDECSIGDETLQALGAEMGGDGGGACVLATLHLENSPEPLTPQHKNEIGPAGATAIAAALALGRSHCRLTSINLRSNAILKEGARAFAAALKQSGDSESERMGRYDQRATGSSLSQSQSTLLHLDLSGNNIQCAATAAALVAVACTSGPSASTAADGTATDGTATDDAADARTGLERLHLFNNDLGDEVCDAIAQVMSQAQAQAEEQQPWCSLIQLDLGANKITSAGCNAILGPLAHYIPPNPSLTLELGGNDMGPDGEAAAVALKAATNGHVDVARDKPNAGPSADEEELDAKEQKQEEQGMIQPGVAGTAADGTGGGAGAGGAEPKAPEHGAEVCKRAGNGLYAAKKFEEAAGKYGEAITLLTSPTLAESSDAVSSGPPPALHALYSNRSMCYLGLQQYEKACADARLSIEESGTFSKGYHRLVSLHYSAMLVCYVGLLRHHSTLLCWSAMSP